MSHQVDHDRHPTFTAVSFISKIRGQTYKARFACSTSIDATRNNHETFGRKMVTVFGSAQAGSVSSARMFPWRVKNCTQQSPGKKAKLCSVAFCAACFAISRSSSCGLLKCSFRRSSTRCSPGSRTLKQPLNAGSPHGKFASAHFIGPKLVGVK